MAVDEALLRHVQTPLLRIYGWETACVSIGYFQKATVAPSDRPFVRRYTGGGLVEHGRDLTYTLVLPADHPLTTAGTLVVGSMAGQVPSAVEVLLIVVDAFIDEAGQLLLVNSA